MLLLPPREAENQQPLYRITVQLDLNPFLPVSYITRVFRCGAEDGELVGEFGFGRLSNLIFGRFLSRYFTDYLHRLTWNGRPGWLQIGDTTARRISSVLTNGASVNSFPSSVASLFDNQFDINTEMFRLEREI
jgi:hypothetical protein